MEVEAQEGEILWYYTIQRAHWEAWDVSSLFASSIFPGNLSF